MVKQPHVREEGDMGDGINLVTQRASQTEGCVEGVNG